MKNTGRAAVLDLLDVDVSTVLFAVVGLMFVADTAMTAYALERGFVEGNPLMRAVLERAGIVGLATAKAAALVCIGYGSRLTEDPELALKSRSAAVLVIYLVVICSNAYQMFMATAPV